MRPQSNARSATSLPLLMDDIRLFLRTLDWEKMREDVTSEAQARLAIVGPVNSGKSTLFNLLEGKTLSPVSPIPGTTKEVISENLGPFMLMDTPGFGEVGGADRASTALHGAAQAAAIVVVFDAAAGLRSSDVLLLDSLRELHKPLIVVANKIDLVGKDAAAVEADMAQRLGLPVIAISAKKGTNVGERLMPAILDALPEVAVAMGRSLPAFRRQAANKVIRNAVILNGGIGAEPIPFIDIPLLLTNQGRMVLRIAAIYGEPFTATHAKELIATMAGGLGLRFLAQEAAKAMPVAGWAAAGAIAALGTWGIGQVALQYFENGKRMDRREIRELYKSVTKNEQVRLKGLPEDQQIAALTGRLDAPPTAAPDQPAPPDAPTEQPPERQGLRLPFQRRNA
jgi:small GTP-binding protein